MSRPRINVIKNELTPKELEVSKLAISGLTNAEIGKEFYLSPRTIETHLRSVYSKLQLRNRVELTLWLQQNLDNSQCQN
jgi:DNA-binding NarL/FixJ family response regulator